MAQCGNCGVDLEIKTQSLGEMVQVYVGLVDSDANTLKSVFLRYLRWFCEGQQPDHGPDRQYFYDPYHEHVEYDPNDKRYRFSIQLSDSPEGDDWWRGSFKVSRGVEIEDIQDEVRRS